MLVKLNSRVGEGISSRLRPRGFSLVEVIVGALLLMFALAGLVPFFISSLSSASAIRYRSSASNIASERMEQIRQLDFREITDAAYLTTVFGSSESLRGIDFNVSYGVETSTYGDGILKEITVTVDWEAPPRVVAASLTSMFHQQFVGPRVAWLEVTGAEEDPLGTPFPLLKVNYEHPLKIHIAEADWGLVIDNLNEPGMTASNAYLRMNLVDQNGVALSLGDPEEDYEITGLTYEVDGATGDVTDVYFPYTVDSTTLPDGYWEFQAVAFNQYDEPGNLWRLRTRVENDRPAAPDPFLAVAQFGNESIELYWSGGDERDRDRYILKRRAWDWSLNGGLGDWGDWVYLETELDPNATSYLDEGSIASMTDPWGDETTTNHYYYHLWAVDVAGKVGSIAECDEVSIPPAEPVTTTTTLETSTTSSSTTSSTLVPATYSVQVVNTVNKTWTLVIECSDPVLYRTETVGKNATVTISNLAAGEYLITASTAGRADRTASFTLDGPEDEGMIVMTIL